MSEHPRDPSTPVPPVELSDEERRARAVQMRLAGATYTMIATRCGYSSPQAAHRAVQNELEESTPEENVGKLRSLMQAQIETARRSIWARVVQGDAGAIDTFCKLFDRYVKITPGLEAPKNVVFKGDEDERPRWMAVILQQLVTDPGTLSLAEDLGLAIGKRMETHPGLPGMYPQPWPLATGTPLDPSQSEDRTNGDASERSSDRDDAGEARQE